MAVISTLEVELRGKDVNIDTLLAGVEKRLRALDAQGKASNPLQGVGNSARQAQPNVLALEQAEARLLATQGNLPGAAQRISAALDGQTARTRQVIAAETQLAQIHNRMSGQTQSLTSLFGQQRDTIANLGGQFSQLGGTAGALSGQIGQLAGSLGGLGAIGAELGIIKTLGELAQAGAKIDATRQSFDALAISAGTTGDVLLTSLRAAAKGTVSDAELIQSANSGILLTGGTLAKELPRLLEIARASAQASGDDIGFVFDSLVKGIARGSPQIIDNAKITLDAAGAFETYAASIGKSPDQLTRVEQQQATLNAVMAAGTDIIAKTGGAADTNAQAFARLGTALTNFKDRGAQGLADVFGRYIQSGFQAIDATSSLVSSFQSLGTTTAAEQAATAAYAATLDATGSSVQANAAYAAALAQAQTQVATVTPVVTAAVLQGGGAYNAYAQAANASGIAAQATAGQMAFSAQAMQQNAEAAVLATARQQAQSQVTAVLTQETQTAANAFLAMNPTIDAAGIAAAVAAGRVPALVGQLAALQLQALRTAGAMSQLAAQQAGISGVSKLFASGTQFSGAARGIAGGLGGGAPRNNAGAIVLPNIKPPKIRGGGGGALSAQTKLNNSLLANQDQYAQKSEDAEKAHLDRIIQINEDFGKRLREAQDSFAQEQLDGRAGFYDSLGSIEDAGLRQALSAQYEAAFQEADAIAREKGADVGQKFLEAKQAAIEAQGKRASEIAEATKQGDADKAAYLTGVDKLYRDAEDRKLQAIKDGKDSLAAQQDAALAEEGSKYADAQEKIATSADQAAERKIAAAARSGQAVDAEGLKVDALKTKYDGLATAASRAGITPAPAGTTTAPTTSPAPATGTPAANAGASTPGDVASALAALRDAIGAVERATTNAGKGVESAVRGLSGKFAT